MNYTIKIADSSFVFTAKEGETISQAAERHNIQLKLGCRQGACGACKGKILSGRVDNSGAKEFALSQEERNNNMALYCCAKPLSDLVIENKGAKPIEFKPTKFKVKISGIKQLTTNTVQVELNRLDNGKFDFLAGQAIDFILPGGNIRSYSISSPSTVKGTVSLLIRHIPGGLFTEPLFDGSVTVGDVFDVESPLGGFTFKTPKEKLAVFLVTGTGIAPVLSMLRTMKAKDTLAGRNITIFYGAKTTDEIYFRSELESYAEDYPTIKFFPVISREPSWTGLKGHVQQAAAQVVGDMRNCDAYLCGSTPMVRAATDFLVVRCGLKEENTHSDAFGGNY